MNKVDEILHWQEKIRQVLSGEAHRLTNPEHPLDMAPHATSWKDSLNGNGQKWAAFFGPTCWKVWRWVESFDPTNQVKAKPHGGSCFVTTADMRQFRGRKMIGPGRAVEIIDAYPTLSQILDAVLPIPEYPLLFISEDDLFMDFWVQIVGEGHQFRLVREAFKLQIERTVIMTKNWAEFLTGKGVSVRNVLFSEVKEELDNETKRWVGLLSDLLGRPVEMRDRAKVVYSYVGQSWPRIIGEDGIIISEPLHHDVNPLSMASPKSLLYDLHLALLEYYRRYRIGIELPKTHLIGYLGAIGNNGELAYSHTSQKEGICVGNKQEYLQKLLRQLNRPFPLNQNQLFLDAINLLFFDPDHRKRILELIDLEEEYRQRKKAGMADRGVYQDKARTLLGEFYSDIEGVLEIIGF